MTETTSPRLAGVLQYLRERSTGPLPGTPLTLSQEGAQEIIAEIGRLQADLDILARQLIGEMDAGYEVMLAAVPRDEVKAALYRWQKARRDMEEEGEAA